MKLVLSLAVVWMLCSSAGALRCRVEGGGRACAAGELCAAAALQGGQQLKACASPSVCSPNNQTFSFNFGSVNMAAAVYCCNTSECNTQDVTGPAANIKTPLQCFTCGAQFPACNRTVQCEGEQDRCLRASVAVGNNIQKVSGCASRNLCGVSSQLSFLSGSLNFTKAPQCCDTKLCNSAGSFSLSAAPLLLGLIVFVGF